MIENEINVNGRFSLRVNFNLVLKKGTKAQIWLTIVTKHLFGHYLPRPTTLVGYILYKVRTTCHYFMF